MVHWLLKLLPRSDIFTIPSVHIALVRVSLTSKVRKLKLQRVNLTSNGQINLILQYAPENWEYLVIGLMIKICIALVIQKVNTNSTE